MYRYGFMQIPFLGAWALCQAELIPLWASWGLFTAWGIVWIVFWHTFYQVTCVLTRYAAEGLFVLSLGLFVGWLAFLEVNGASMSMCLISYVMAYCAKVYDRMLTEDQIRELAEELVDEVRKGEKQNG